jgi:hypothetical protein
VQFNSQQLFTDLELPENKVSWDLDGNGSVDQKDKVNFTNLYQDPQLYYIYYNLPGLSTDYYGFALRVQQDDRAGCTV